MAKKKIILDIISNKTIKDRIFILRGKRIMMDQDLAVLYEVETKVFNQSIKRNKTRFPEDFMFQLTKEEFENLKSQIVTSSWGGRRYAPYTFTEQGVAMLSSVLNSERAIQVNIQIMRTFTMLKEMISSNADLKKKVKAMEKKFDYQFKAIFQAIDQLLEEPQKKSKKKIGF